MSEVNKTIYPDRATGLTGIQLTSTQLADLELNTTWETSIAIAQSTSENAAYNVVTFMCYDTSVTIPQIVDVKVTNPVQKTALVYTQTLANIGSNQYYGNTIYYTGQYYNVQQFNDAPYNFYSLRRYPVAGAWTEGLINEMQSHYNKRALYLITGANFQKILGVICVAFTDKSYCSLKYYEQNKTSSLSSKTPSALFMVGLIDNDDGGYLQTFDMFNMSDMHYHFWQRNEQTGIITENESDLQFLFPSPVLGGLNLIDGSRNIGTISAPSLVMPLVACMGGSEMNFTNYWTAKPAAGTPIYGGTLGVHYTTTLDGTLLKTVLTQAGLDNAHRAAACYGIPFCDDFPFYLHDFYTDASLITYIPTANDGGYYNGTYEVLTVNGVVSSQLSPENAEIWNGGKDAPYNDRSYNPDIPIPTDAIDLIHPTLTGIDCFNKTYILNRNDVEELGGYFWSADDNIIDQVKKAFALFGEKPINGVINLMLFPFNVREKSGSTTATENIKIGTWNSGINAYRLAQTANAVYDFGSFKWDRVYNNFLDYAPFTTAELYVPFFGVFPLANENFIGKNIDIKCIVDFVTGAATCVIYVTDGDKRQPVIYRSSTLGVQIPVSGDDVAQRVTALLDNGLKLGGDIVQGATAAATGNVGGVISAGINSAVHEFGASAVPTLFNSAGSSSPECSLYMPKKPYVILHLPDIMTPENYGHTVGFSCEKTVTINDVSGFAVFANVDLSGIVATSQEIDEIKRLLETGVYC